MAAERIEWLGLPGNIGSRHNGVMAMISEERLERLGEELARVQVGTRLIFCSLVVARVLATIVSYAAPTELAQAEGEKVMDSVGRTDAWRGSLLPNSQEGGL